MAHITLALVLATAALPGGAPSGWSAPAVAPGYAPWALPLGPIEFLEESGVERWHVRLAGEDVHVRIAGSGCTFLGEIPPGYVTVLFDNLAFTTTGGRRCQVTAIER